MFVKFQGETRHDSIVNHFCLDIEEDAFFAFLKEMGYDEDAEDEMIESLYQMWFEKYYN